jgi:hypothetical protein
MCLTLSENPDPNHQGSNSSKQGRVSIPPPRSTRSCTHAMDQDYPITGPSPGTNPSIYPSSFHFWSEEKCSQTFSQETWIFFSFYSFWRKRDPKPKSRPVYLHQISTNVSSSGIYFYIYGENYCLVFVPGRSRTVQTHVFSENYCSVFVQKNHDFCKKEILVWCDDPPEDRVISIFAGCLVNHDHTH